MTIAANPNANGHAQHALTPRHPLDVINPAVIARKQELAAKYAANQPFPHIVIDDFFRPEIIEAIRSGFPEMEQMPKLFREPMSYKGQLSDIDRRWPRFSALFAALQSDAFRAFMSEISGIDALLADPILAGGGLHQSPQSGFLDIHVDANFHPMDKALHRRLNLLVYATPSWNESWGGQLQLWNDNDKAPGSLAGSIEPRWNRAVLFSTTRTSWHGVAPVACPEGETRRSIALYYYTHSRPDHEQYTDSSVIWFAKTPLKRAVYPLMNAAIARLKPYAKWLRRIRGKDTFDSSK